MPLLASNHALVQIDPTAQQQTVDAFVQQQFAATWQVRTQNAEMRTVQAATANFQATSRIATANIQGTAQAEMSATQAATDNYQGTLQAAFGMAQTATAQAQVGVVRSTVEAHYPQAFDFNGGNADWTPIEQKFDGVAMVLVPVGCFNMGSDTGLDDEQPAHEICFGAPFWIDQYEVTNGQFARVGGSAANGSSWTGENQPRESITWVEAQDFCALREMRLPTEAEWEYAARGPDDLEYPWGDSFVPENVVYNPSGTADVGSRPAGVSWVGALDMSGNVWEWIHSLYEPYPYDPADGREADTGGRTDVSRVLRGGSWLNYVSSDYFRASTRNWNPPDVWLPIVGFRCARSS